MCGPLKYLLIILLMINSISAHASGGYSADDKKLDLDNAAHCKKLPDGFHILDDAAACFSGEILPETVIMPKSAIDAKLIKTLYVNSLGGEILSAMALGRSIYETEVKLVLYQSCFSSCANYLAPAATDLVIQKGTIFGLHGSSYRSSSAYVNGNNSFVNAPDTPETIQKIILEIRKYPDFYKNMTAKESLYFLDIGVSEQYVTRFFEISRNRKIYNNGKCGNIPSVAIMTGPEYLELFFNSNILEFDWDKEAIKANPLFDEIFKPTYSIVFDNDLFPTMTPERGEIDPLECFSFITK